MHRLFSENCLICGNEIKITQRQIPTRNGSICMGCEDATLNVWHVTITLEKGGYCKRHHKDIIDVLQDMGNGDSYTIRKDEMMAVEFHNLEEFQGF